MSIVRVGLSQNQKFAEGYEAIFGKKQSAGKKAEKPTGKTGSKKRNRAKKK